MLDECTIDGSYGVLWWLNKKNGLSYTLWILQMKTNQSTVGWVAFFGFKMSPNGNIETSPGRHRQLLDHSYPSTWAQCALHKSQRGRQVNFNRGANDGPRFCFFGRDKFEVEEEHSKKVRILWWGSLSNMSWCIAKAEPRDLMYGVSTYLYPHKAPSFVGKYTIRWADLGMWILRWTFMRLHFHRRHWTSSKTC